MVLIQEVEMTRHIMGLLHLSCGCGIYVTAMVPSPNGVNPTLNPLTHPLHADGDSEGIGHMSVGRPLCPRFRASVLSVLIIFLKMKWRKQ